MQFILVIKIQNAMLNTQLLALAVCETHKFAEVNHDLNSTFNNYHWLRFLKYHMQCTGLFQRWQTNNTIQ